MFDNSVEIDVLHLVEIGNCSLILDFSSFFTSLTSHTLLYDNQNYRGQIMFSIDEKIWQIKQHIACSSF